MTAVQARDSRILRARELILSHSYLVTAGAIFVYSDTPKIAGYTVEHNGQCSCADATIGTAHQMLDGHCKHWELCRLLAQSHVTEAQRLVAGAKLAAIASIFAD